MVKKKGKSRNVKSCNLYNTDFAAKNIWQHLLRDFRSIEGPEFCSKASDAFDMGVPFYRGYNYPCLGEISPNRFKMYKQMEGLLKKYRFQTDSYTDEELLEKTQHDFIAEQQQFATHKELPPLAALVLRRARKIARRILGKYSEDLTISMARFGRKSSIGCPLSQAYIDIKLSDVRAFTGSSDCASWFMNDVVPFDPILNELVGCMLKQGMPDHAHESLNLVLVPKSWKALRPITPLTLLALFYSFGVGNQVVDRLSRVGLVLSRLQNRHRKLVREMSRTRKYATADLSSASQSLVSWLLNRVLPREWYVAIKRTFSRQTIVNGRSIYTESVLPMGNGLTFPIETLVFYVILEAMRELTGTRGFVSVYGDDLIYPSRLHSYVSVIFPMLGFKLNLDKTFVRSGFRESCGSDFYKGCDVRPAFLPEGSHRLTRTKYALWLYKAYNSLSRRWNECEIRQTLRYILIELAALDMPLYRVPPSYPDTSGVKVCDPEVIPLGMSEIDWSPIKRITLWGSGWFDYSFLSETPERRAVKVVLPYYWLALQSLDDEPGDDKPWHIDNYESPRQPLIWKTQRFIRYVNVDAQQRKRIVKLKHSAYVSSRSETKVKVRRCRVCESSPKSDPVSDWI